MGYAQGTPATICIGSDRYPATVVKVSPSGKTITVRDDIATFVGHDGSFGVQKWTFSPDPKGRETTFRLTKRGWTRGCYRLVLGERDRYDDPHF